jgi:hypothetical protein
MVRFVALLAMFPQLWGCSGPCEPGKTVPCACSNGAQGSRVCLEDETYSSCNCDEKTQDKGVSGRKDAGIGYKMDMRGGGADGSPPHGAKRVFVTSSAYQADLQSRVSGAVSGLHAGDLLCQQAAQGALLGGTWKVWLSGENSVGGRINAIDRISDVGPWFRLDGARAFNNKANLGSTPLSPLSIDEHGAYASVMVWTGTVAGGNSADSTCLGWTNTFYNDDGGHGISTESGTGWTDVGPWPCNKTAHLYCLEQ